MLNLLSITIFACFFAVINKRTYGVHRKFWLIIGACSTLLCSMYSTVQYQYNGKILAPFYKVGIEKTSVLKERFQNFMYLGKRFRFGHSLLPLIYSLIAFCYGSNHFFEGFFFTCILSCILFLFSQHLLFKIFDLFNISKRTEFCYCLLFHQPSLFFYGALPIATSPVVFSLLLLLHSMIKGRPICVQILILYLMFLFHKLFYLSFFAFIVFHIIIAGGFRWSALILKVAISFYIALHVWRTKPYGGHLSYVFSHMCGNSYIPPTNGWLSRLLNFSLAPLLTNGCLFFYKAPNGSKLYWIYATIVNIELVCMAIRIMYLRRFFPRLNKQGKILCFVLFLFIVSFHVGGISVNNYCCNNRHLVNTTGVWIVLALVLESGSCLQKNIFRKSTLA